MNAPSVFSMNDRESQLINLALNQAEQQLLEGKASPTVLTHFLKLGCSRYEYETEKLKAESELARAKIENLQAAEHREELYQNAIEAMRRYSGFGETYD